MNGKHNNLNGFDGLVRYFEKRQEIELKIIENLPIDNLIVNNHNYNWKDISHNILKNIN